MGFFTRWLACIVAVFVALWIVPGITVVGGPYAAPILTALVLAFMNVSLKPLLQILSLPISVLTLGIFAFIINAFILQFSGVIAVELFGQGLVMDSFGSALLASIIISVVTAYTS